MLHSIVLAGGTGSRLYPMSSAVNKHLMPVFDKPMIFYSISLAMLAGARDISVICNANDLESYIKLLGDGSNYGVHLEYIVQDKALGICDGLRLGLLRGFERNLLLLGDNILVGGQLKDLLTRFCGGEKKSSALVCHVNEPKKFGVLRRSRDGVPIEVVEKPDQYISNEVVTGIYCFPNSALGIVEQMEPSARGEFEVSDLLNYYIKNDDCSIFGLSRADFWIDAGEPTALFEAAQVVFQNESRTGKQIACLEEIALDSGWIDRQDVERVITTLPAGRYRDYLERL